MSRLSLYSIAINFCLISTSLLAETAATSEVDWNLALAAAAIERTQHEVEYNGSYRIIDYPLGDVPDNIGVCTDVIIRAFRQMGVDLQQQVHEDMQSHFSAYPAIWGLNHPDPNIDHRRVPNLQTFFTRQGKSMPISTDAGHFHPGDIVTWMLPGNLPHIGIVSNIKDKQSQNPMIVHNIGAGPKLENMLFQYPISGHYRYHP